MNIRLRMIVGATVRLNKENGMGESTDVCRVTPPGVTTLVFEGTGLAVVGAGVNTCGPTE